jgi:hypothetical protein
MRTATCCHEAAWDPNCSQHLNGVLPHHYVDVLCTAGCAGACEHAQPPAVTYLHATLTMLCHHLCLHLCIAYCRAAQEPENAHSHLLAQSCMVLNL